jgi:hypothetical protein
MPMKPLPRATVGDGIAPDQTLWNRLCDEIERIDRLSVSSPLELIDAPAGKTLGIRLTKATQDGIVVCHGPQGQADYDDERYWVQFARCNNHDNDPTSNLDFVPDSSGTIVTATDLFEYNAGTHAIGAGTPVILFPTISVDGLKRWRFIAGDESPSGSDCGGSSGSSSGSGSGSGAGRCVCVWQYSWDCASQTGITTILGSTCGNQTGLPAGIWSLTSSASDHCIWKLPEITGNSCSTDGDCTIGFCGPAPAPPNSSECCVGSGSICSGSPGSIGSAPTDVCIYEWNCKWTPSSGSGEGTWSRVRQSGVNCDSPANFQFGAWVPSGTSCVYHYYAQGAACPGPEETSDCEKSWPVDPPPPNFVGNCGSGSDSGSGSETGSGSSAGSGSSMGSGCVCVPSPPSSGQYVLVSNDGVLSWMQTTTTCPTGS